jgi:hypothetical protein
MSLRVDEKGESEQMGLKSVVGSVLGTLLLAGAALSFLWGLVLVGASLYWGLTALRLQLLVVAFGLAFTLGFTGYYIRRLVAGTVLALDYDVSVGFRGGQGGL